MAEKSVVLLHGAGIGPWAWDRVRSRLSVPSLAPEVPGRVVGATPEACVKQLGAEIDAFTAGDVVVVAHSLCGVLVPGLAAHLGPRLKHVIYVSSVTPAAGQSFLGAIGFPMSLVMRALFAMRPRGLRPSDSMIRSGLCNDLDEQDTAQVITKYAHEFPGLYTTPVAGPPAVVPSTYIRLTKDGSVSVAAQTRMIAMLTKPQVFDLDAGHLPMLSRPDEVAEIVLGAARQAAQ